MGLIATCEFTVNGESATGEAHLEPTELRLVARTKVVIPFAAILSAEALGGSLQIRYRGGEATLRLGKAAATWALKIRYPKGRTEKLGVKAGARIALMALNDPAFNAEDGGREGRGAPG